MKDNGKMVKDGEKELKSIKTVHCMLDYGNTMFLMDRAHIIINLETLTKVNFLMESLVVTDYIYIKMELNMRVNGKMINNMDMEQKLGQIVQNIKGNINME